MDSDSINLPPQHVQLKDIKQTMYQSQERLTKLETDREPPTTEEVPLQNNMRDNLNNAPNSDEQFLKSIKLDVPTFHGRLDP